MITLPNSNLIRATVENNGARRYRTQKFTVLLSYGNPLELVLDFVRRARGIVESNPNVRADNVSVSIDTLNENSIGILFNFQLLTQDNNEEADLKEAILTQVLMAAKESRVVLGGMPWLPLEPPELQRTQNQSKTAPVQP